MRARWSPSSVLPGVSVAPYPRSTADCTRELMLSESIGCYAIAGARDAQAAKRVR